MPAPRLLNLDWIAAPPNFTPQAENFTVQSVLDGILYFRVQGHTQQLALMHTLDALLTSQPQVHALCGCHPTHLFFEQARYQCPPGDIPCVLVWPHPLLEGSMSLKHTVSLVTAQSDIPGNGSTQRLSGLPAFSLPANLFTLCFPFLLISTARWSSL